MDVHRGKILLSEHRSFSSFELAARLRNFSQKLLIGNKKKKIKLMIVKFYPFLSYVARKFARISPTRFLQRENTDVEV